MHRLETKRLAIVVLLCALPLAAVAAEGPAPPPAAEAPVTIDADRMRGIEDREIEAEGDVRLRRPGQAVSADWLHYDRANDEITATGRVRIERGTDVIEGSRLRFQLETERGHMEEPSYTLYREPPAPGEPPVYGEIDARGTADRLLFEGPGLYRAERAQYTTCGPDNDDWYVRTRTLEIDKGRNVGVARHSSIVFKGVPLFYTPYLSFSLHRERKSGFLTPSYGSTSRGGAELSVPYYWNIAPNRDLTFAPRVMSRRGVLLHTEFRYLEPSHLGEARIEYLPQDNVTGSGPRHAYHLRHNHALPYDWHGALTLQGVSDGTYFTDLSTQIALTSQVVLPREGTLSRGGTWGRAGTYGFSALVQRWQTLQADPLVPITAPYHRAPQLTFTAGQPDVGYGDFDLFGQFVAFDHPSLLTGRRALVYPSFNVPLQAAYGHVTPKLGATVTRYVLDSNAGGFVNETRVLPVASVDSGLVFERETRLGGASFLQTLEPRLYYVYIPFRDQNRLPVFDSGQQDINFATIYSENQFAGWDRINNANQVTLGVNSRFLDPQSGAERLRVGLAQRYYFATQQVTLPGVPPRTSNSSDLLAALSGRVARNWVAEAGWQYSTNFSETQKFNIGTRYQPAPGRVLNLSYRETLNSIRQTDISTQWPIGQGWTGLARWNYSLRESRMLEGLLGLEYAGDCWVLRVVGHRFATATQETSTTFFVQLELNGVSRIGSNPMEALRRNIGGYQKIDPRAPRPEPAETPYYY
jgi:LPS-assembly protein